MNKDTQENYFLSQPHQPFFILGILNALIAMLLFALSYKGIISLTIDTKTFHAYSLIYLVFTNVFTGFLFTTFPRFNQTQVIQKSYYSSVFFATLGASALFMLSTFLSSLSVTLAMILLFISQFFVLIKLHQIYKEAKAADKSDSLWILSASYFGLLSHALFILSQYFPLLLSIAINSAFYLYLIFLALSVGQRMIPFFSHSFAQKNENFLKVLLSLFVLKAIFSATELKIGEILIDLALAAYTTKEFLRWKLHPFSSPAILWVLHLALAWIPLGFFLSALTQSAALFLETSFYFLNTHLLAIGFLTTLLIGFGTRVTLGHSGQSPQGDALATKIFLFIQVVVLSRVLFSLNIAFGWGLDFLFDISFTLWLLLFFWWGGRYAKVLLFGSKL
jgi:uncharacterized protein involved in response to NO